MKIKRSDLPESIAAALEPRTFAQERPEEGARIEVEGHNGTWYRGRYSARFSCLFTGSYEMDVSNIWKWKPVIEIIEDEPQEPQRKLPEPGKFFVIQGRLAYATEDDERYWLESFPDGTRCGRNPTSIDTLPGTWTSFPDLIAKAARVEELEATLDIYRLGRDDLNAQLSQKDDRISALKDVLGDIAETAREASE